MKQLLLIVTLLLTTGMAAAQPSSNRVIFVTADPPTVCTPGKIYTNSAANKSWMGKSDSTCTPYAMGTPGTVTTTGTMTANALVTSNGTTVIKTPSATATLDASGNLSTPGTIASGAGGSTTGVLTMLTGTAPSSPAVNNLSLFFNSANSDHLSVKNSAGAVTDIQAGGIGGSTGATDNAILRADGAGGVTLQSSGVTIDDSNTITAPSLAVSGSAGVTFTTRSMEMIGDVANAIDFAGTDGNRVFAIFSYGSGQMGVTVAGGATLGFSDAGFGQVATKDTTLSRNAAGVVQIGTTVANASGSLLATNTTLSGPAITAGSGSGVTVNNNGILERATYKVTVTFAALAAAGLTADKVIATLPAKTRLVSIIADTTTPYTGGGVTAATLIVGKTTGGNEYIVSHDVLSAAIVKGLADSDLGTSINRANAIQGGDLPSWTTTTDISVRLTTVTANTDQLTAGSTTYYLVTEKMP